MDSVTQIVLGAAICGPVLGPQMGARRAVIAGAILGTLPDLDVLYQFADPIDSFTLHRGPSHAFAVQALVAPLFGEALVRWSRRLGEGFREISRLRAAAAVFLAFSTHALIDWMTVYGTRILWPMIPDAFGVGSLFIVDPLYTAPLIFFAVRGLRESGWTPRVARTARLALILSTLYAGWSVGAQQWALAKAEPLLEKAGLSGAPVFATPTPLTTVAWKVIARAEDRYVVVYLNLFSSDAVAYEYPTGLDSLAKLADRTDFQRLRTFADGFVDVISTEEGIVVRDLRMGLEPSYVFRFVVADATGQATPARKLPPSFMADGDGDWLLGLVTGDVKVRPVEAQAAIE